MEVMTQGVNNVNTILLDMPAKIRAYTVSNSDESYTVVLNSRLNYETQLKAFHHELLHIINRDYEKKCPADLIELYAHK